MTCNMREHHDSREFRAGGGTVKNGVWLVMGCRSLAAANQLVMVLYIYALQ